MRVKSVPVRRSPVDTLVVNRRAMAVDLMVKHGIGTWSLSLDRSKTRGGLTHFGKKTIYISTNFISQSSDKEFVNLVLHEIAHGIAGPTAGHGRAWQDVATSIGCDGKRCIDVPIEYKYQVTCGCGAVNAKRIVIRKTLVTRVCTTCRGQLTFDKL